MNLFGKIQRKELDHKMKHYRICLRHLSKKDHAILFWGKNSQGYTYNLNNAGLYEGKSHTEDDPLTLASIVDPLAIDSVIDNTTLGKIVLNNKANRKTLNIDSKKLLNCDTNWTWLAFQDPKEFLTRTKKLINLVQEVENKYEKAI